MTPQVRSDLSSLERRLTTFIRNELDAAQIHRAVLGLSGGVDSSLVAFLCCKALGAENVLGIMLPYRTSSPSSIVDAQKVVDALGIRSERVEITPMLEPLFAADPTMDQVRRGNAMARARMIVLYDRSARDTALVVGTGNKTELLLGYSTLYGDSACAIAPLGDLYKTEVWKLAEHMGVPDSIVHKAPSADLWEGQTDESELGFTYRRVDELLHAMYEENLDVDSLQTRGFERSFIEAVTSRIEKYRFKRSLPSIPLPGE